MATIFDNPKASVLSETLDDATAAFLEANRSPSRKVNELDNRGSHFYLTLFWAEALAAQDIDVDLKAAFTPLASELRAKELTIVDELNSVQGQPMDIGGYYHTDVAKTTAAMRPSATLNSLLATL